MNVKARAKILIIVFCILLLLSLGAITYAARTTKEAIYINSDYDVAFAENFRGVHQKYYNGLDYKKVEGDSISFTIETIAEGMDMTGYNINGTKYAIHLLICSKNDGICAFRINGIPTGGMKPSTDKTDYIFSLGNGYAMKIDKVIFNYCGDTFCDYELELYDIVDISIFKE